MSMWKTFVASPLAGGLAAVFGWMGALLFEASMTEAEFADLRFGWAGALIGAVAIACIVMVLLAAKTVEPLILVTCAGLTTAMLWGRRELPFSTENFSNGTQDGYWSIVTVMLLVFILLVTGLRAARMSNERAR